MHVAQLSGCVGQKPVSQVRALEKVMADGLE
jgi:hypothetical protein